VEEDVVAVAKPEQFKALGHPMRHRLLFALGQGEATISQLAAMLDSNKGNVAHHLKMLAHAGLVEHAGTRHVRGGTEQYYRRTFERLQFEDTAGLTEAAFSAVASDIAAAETEPFVMLRNLRLTAQHAERLTAALREFADEPEDGDDQPRYGLLLGLYKRRAAFDAGNGR
jgi:DNA-binding transcriptional ArsR family regulator